MSGLLQPLKIVLVSIYQCSLARCGAVPKGPGGRYQSALGRGEGTDPNQVDPFFLLFRHLADSGYVAEGEQVRG